jgi:post-segregation antitoxin (ccd killing protein)
MAKILVKTKVIRITEVQHDILKKMQSYKIDVGKFIREAISEKIKREYSDLLPKQKNICPF